MFLYDSILFSYCYYQVLVVEQALRDIVCS
jgi:hypothetical protein